jgi:hypothetical protein
MNPILGIFHGMLRLLLQFRGFPLELAARSFASLGSVEQGCPCADGAAQQQTNHKALGSFHSCVVSVVTTHKYLLARVNYRKCWGPNIAIIAYGNFANRPPVLEDRWRSSLTMIR